MRVLRGGVYLFAFVGAVLTLYLGSALALDARNLDRTRGGYEPPYTGYTGEPLRFDEVALTADGGVVRGRVLDSLIDCRTGGWRFDILGFLIDYRGVSERALVVHKPQVLCRQHGFDTSVWDKGY